MEKNKFYELDIQMLETMQSELYQKIESLPGKFEVSGAIFSWLEYHDCLSVTSKDNWGNIRLSKDGEIQYYSFFSEAGEGQENAEKTIWYYELCIRLLSADFRMSIVEDYRNKLPELEAIRSEIKEIHAEKERRHQEIREKERSEKAERQKVFEQPGQVWVNLSEDAQCRYTVKTAAEKSVLFTMWRYDQYTGEWKECKDRRVMKANLGYSAPKFNIRFMPVGINSLDGQEPIEPMTVEYL